MENSTKKFYNIINDKELVAYIKKRKKEFSGRTGIKMPIESIKEKVIKPLEFKGDMTDNSHWYSDYSGDNRISAIFEEIDTTKQGSE